MPDLTQLVALGSIAYTLVNFIRYAGATDWSSVVSQAVAWAVGVCTTLLVAHTDLAAAFTFGSKTLGQVGWLSQFLVGLAAASSISIVYQFTKAVDTSQSARVPSMLRNRTSIRPVETAAVGAGRLTIEGDITHHEREPQNEFRTPDEHTTKQGAMGEFKGLRGVTLRRLPVFIAVVVLGITAALFVLVGIFVGFLHALDILELRGSPSGKDTGWKISLSVFGYLLVPTFIALAVTTVLQLFTARRLIQDEEVDQRIKDAIESALAKTNGTTSAEVVSAEPTSGILDVNVGDREHSSAPQSEPSPPSETDDMTP
jgi:hypothetical protein